jgi:hypothetical protein
MMSAIDLYYNIFIVSNDHSIISNPVNFLLMRVQTNLVFL